jgi:O-antigen ligase
LKLVLRVFLGVASLVFLYALAQYLNPAIDPVLVRGTFGNRNVLGGFVALTLPLLFALLLFDVHRLRRVWYATAIAIGLCVSLSGGTLIALALSFGVIAALRGRVAFLLYALVLILVAAFVAPALPRKNGEIARVSVRLCDEQADTAARYKYWQAAARMAMDHPWAGVGSGGYQNRIHDYDADLSIPPGHKEDSTENTYLVLASTVGLPGLAMFCGLLLFGAVRAGRAFLQNNDGFEKGLALGVLGSLVAFGINCLWSQLLVRGLGLPLVLVLALGGAVAANGAVRAAAEPSRGT